MDIPNQGMTFGTLIRAQALGDYEALVATGRRMIRVLISSPADLSKLADALK
jgi:hypothetical protein